MLDDQTSDLVQRSRDVRVVWNLPDFKLGINILAINVDSDASGKQ